MSTRWTPQDLAEYQARRGVGIEIAGGPRVSKYNNQKTPAFGIMFASKKEANRYEQLRLMEIGGLVKNIKIQVRYRLEVNGMHICDYIADFVYLDKIKKSKSDPWVEVVEDTKGVRTAVYKLKKKLMLALHGIEIRET